MLPRPPPLEPNPRQGSPGRLRKMSSLPMCKASSAIGWVSGWCRVPCLPLPRRTPTGPFPPSVCFRRRRRRRHGHRAVVRVKAPSSVSVRWRERGREGRKVVALAGRGDVVGGCAPHNVSEQAVSSDKQQQARDGPVPTRHYGSSVTDCGRTMNSE